MTRSRHVRLAAVLGVLGTFGLAASSAGTAGSPAETTYQVTIRNLTSGQPFSPPVAATHRKAIRMFRVGHLASDELALIAQDGNEIPMFQLFSSSPHVTQAVDVGRPLTRMGTTVGSFTDSATFEIAARPGDRLSLATMLICTNDGFLGLDAVKLPDDSATFLLNGYDAGREQNTEQSVDLVDPCSLLGPAPLPGDPDGNRDAEVGTVPAAPIAHHPGISGTGELGAAHAWTDPVAEVTVERIG
jgi:Spondin_N